MGAVTQCSGVFGRSGFVSEENSLVGSHSGDWVGEDGIVVLPNSNYVVRSQHWNGGRGAITFINSVTGSTGIVSADNSLVGNAANSTIGYITALSSGNYIVGTSGWSNGSESNIGAVTFGSKTSGVSGVISAANSLVGTNSGDGAGNGGLFELPNGNFLVRSVSWNGSRGAITFARAETGVTGVISASNSLIGTKSGDSLSLGNSGITVLANGNYVVGSPQWDRGDVNNVGAATFCRAAIGCVGEISISNSLIGTTANDLVGNNVTKLPNGNYLVGVNSWDNGAVVDAGAVTGAFGNDPASGEINSGNSVLGSTANGGNRQVSAYDYRNRQIVVGRPNVNSLSLFRMDRATFDYDGDGKADISVFRPSNGTWYLQQSREGFTGIAFGQTGDKLVPGDFDGDGKTDVAVYRNGVWYLQRSQLGFTGIQFGDGNDVPVPADYDGDGKADLAVFRPSNETWYLQQSTAGFTGIAFGISTDKPVPADYDGDGKADIAVNRAGTWYIQRSQLGFYSIQFGDSNDKLVPADYDGDGKADVAVFRPSNGVWYLQQSTAGFTGIAFGLGTDIPVAADYDGDGKADVAVYRAGNWYLNRTAQGFIGIQFGASTDQMIPNSFVR